MQKHVWLGFILAFISITEAKALTVLSDIDDTIKIAHVNSVPSVIMHAPMVKAFSGMSTVYRGLQNNGVAESFYYLSGSPLFLTGHLSRFLDHNDFPDGKLLLRNRRVDPREVGAYKLEALRKFMDTSTDTVMFLGDDTERDADVYAQISREFPGRVDSIYIHRVRGVDLSAEAQAAGALSFFTALDLAKDLYAKGKLAEAGLVDTARAILSERHEHRIVSRFQKCPQFGQVSTLSVSVEADSLLEAAQARVQEVCAD